MKTYKVSKEVSILMVTLYHYRYPFSYDGESVKVTASDKLVKKLCKECMFLTAEDFVEINNEK